MEGKDLNVVAFCGLCCLDCHGRTGKTADFSRDLRKERRQAKYGKYAEAITRVPMGKPEQSLIKKRWRKNGPEGI